MQPHIVSQFIYLWLKIIRNYKYIDNFLCLATVVFPSLLVLIFRNNALVTFFFLHLPSDLKLPQTYINWYSHIAIDCCNNQWTMIFHFHFFLFYFSFLFLPYLFKIKCLYFHSILIYFQFPIHFIFVSIQFEDTWVNSCLSFLSIIFHLFCPFSYWIFLSLFHLFLRPYIVCFII